MKMRKALLSLLFFCVAVLSHAQSGPRLVAAADGFFFQYMGGDSVITRRAQALHSSAWSATLIEAPNGLLYGTGYSNPSGGAIATYDYTINADAQSGTSNFGGSNGTSPLAPLVLAHDGKMYGTNTNAGTNIPGTIFSFTPGEDSIKKLINLPPGANPYAAMIQAADGFLYGVTQADGIDTGGTIYRYDIATNTYTVLHNFPNYCYPKATLLEVGADTLYGVTHGANPSSTPPVIFRFIATTGAYTVLANLPYNSFPKGGLTHATDGNLYGMTYSAGLYSKGILFRYNMANGNIDTLHNFGAGTDASNPTGELYQASDGILYGMTAYGGTFSQGTIFQYDIATGTYKVNVNMQSMAMATYGHFIEYKVLPVRRHPIATSLCAGYTAYFVSVDTASTATTQWQVSSDSGTTYANVAGATDSMYYFTATNIQNGNLYRAVFNHNGQSDTSLPAKLSVYPLDTTYLTQSICAGQSVSVLYSNYYTPGIHIVLGQGRGVHSCDSVIKLDLRVYPKAEDTITAAICAGQSYTSGTHHYSSTGIYTDTIVSGSVSGCDSFSTLSLTVYPSIRDTTFASICAGSSYTVGAHSFSTSGVYVDTLTGSSAHGCDSIVTLYLAVLNNTTAYFSIQPAAIPQLWYALNQCVGPSLSYVWNWGDGTPTSTGATPTHIYDTAGYYDICVTVTDSLGCTATFCDTAVYMSKNAGGTVELDVVKQIPTGIENINDDELQISYYQGAFHFSQALAIPTKIGLYDMSGRKVAEQNGISGLVWQTSQAIAPGAYLLHIESQGQSRSRKILILQ